MDAVMLGHPKFFRNNYTFFFLYALMAYHIELNIFLKNQNIFLIRSQRF